MAQEQNQINLEEELEEKFQKKVKQIDLKEKEDEARRIAIITGFHYADLSKFPLDRRTVLLIPKEFAMEKGAISFHRDKKMIKVGLFVPEDDKTREEVEKILEKQDLKAQFYTISETSLEKGLAVYGTIIEIKKDTGKVAISTEELEEVQAEIKSLSDLAEKLTKVPVGEVLQIILAGALKGEASDIHLEPEEGMVKLRYRIDGVLNEMASINSKVYQKVVDRIKLESGLKINVVDKPQDGRFALKLKDREVDMRISILPTAHGETVVMRLLGVGAISLSIEDLGIRGRAHEILEREIKKPNGMILVTGPTGSGKTTTLYACLNKIKSPEKNIVTLENPVEYRLEGITQTQINPGKGLTFSSALRSTLRQDPDVIMVGEIRDFETADIATQAALTGHMVFSTLHTNDASGVIPRLIDLGLRPFTIGPALSAAIGQRLVRRLCEKCKEKYLPSEAEIKYLKTELGKDFPKEKKEIVLYKAKGCPACVKTGYKGRMGVFEIFAVDRTVEELINKRASSLEIFNAVVKEQNMISMLQDGLLRVLEGVTTLDEVERVVG